jgi:6,7-dimethyl-8-ribityllumazine synthase
VIRGETAHFEHVARACVDGLARLQFETGIPIALAVLTTDTVEQALERAGGKSGNKGEEAALAALETADVIDRLAASG